MIFSVKKNTKTYAAITELRNRIKESGKAIKAFGKKYGTTGQYVRPHNCWAGVSHVVFDTPPDKSVWKAKKFNDKTTVYAPKAGTEALKDLKAIPKVHLSELRQVLNYDIQEGPRAENGHGFKCSITPGFEFVGDNYIVTIYDWVTWRHKDLKEITHAELEALKKKHKK